MVIKSEYAKKLVKIYENERETTEQSFMFVEDINGYYNQVYNNLIGKKYIKNYYTKHDQFIEYCSYQLLHHKFTFLVVLVEMMVKQKLKREYNTEY